MTTRDTVITYFRAIEAMDLDAVDAVLHPDVELVEHPNVLNPNGLRTDRAGMRAAGERGVAVMAKQSYEVRTLIVEGDRACAATVWTGVLANGTTMRAQICSVIEVRDGKIWRQEQYDCFEP
jgi:ketosteroid isomerase-like protein